LITLNYNLSGGLESLVSKKKQTKNYVEINSRLMTIKTSDPVRPLSLFINQRMCLPPRPKFK